MAAPSSVPEEDQMNYLTHEWWATERNEMEIFLEKKFEKRFATLERVANNGVALVRQEYAILLNKCLTQEARLDTALSWKRMTMNKVASLEDSVKDLAKEIKEINGEITTLMREVDTLGALEAPQPEPARQEGQKGPSPLVEERQGQDLEEGEMKLDTEEMLLNDIDEGVYLSGGPIQKRGRKEESVGSSTEQTKKARTLQPPPPNTSQNSKPAGSRTRAAEKGKGKK